MYENLILQIIRVEHIAGYIGIYVEQLIWNVQQISSSFHHSLITQISSVHIGDKNQYGYSKFRLSRRKTDVINAKMHNRNTKKYSGSDYYLILLNRTFHI